MQGLDFVVFVVFFIVKHYCYNFLYSVFIYFVDLWDRCLHVNRTPRTFILTKQLSNLNYLPVYMQLSVYMYLLNVGQLFFVSSPSQKYICFCYIAQLRKEMFYDRMNMWNRTQVMFMWETRKDGGNPLTKWHTVRNSQHN
jgi:hypothetical protein